MANTSVRGFQEPAKDAPMSEILGGIFLEGLEAVKRFQQMQERGEDVSYIENTLRKDGISVANLK